MGKKGVHDIAKNDISDSCSLRNWQKLAEIALLPARTRGLGPVSSGNYG